MSELTDFDIFGSGGGKGGGGGRTAQEAPNTLRSAATVRVVEVLGEGEIVGIAGGAKGIYLNDTPLQASDGTYNFARAAWDYRVGLPTQAYMQGFSAIESEVTIGTTITHSAPVSHTSSSANIDAMRVTIQLPQGLSSQNTTNGDLSGSQVVLSIDIKLSSSSSWTNVVTPYIDGKTTSPYERQYRVQRPSGTGTWDVRVSRTTADSTSSALRNQTTLARITEIQEVKDAVVQYNDTAVVGLAIDAESVGNTIPNRSYLVVGLKVQVPSNYNPTTRAYTGSWDGTFLTEWTDNPAWVLYDLLTNERYGLGEFISPTQIDKYSFYDAAVYNDELVPSGVGSATEPRFTFNGVIASRDDALRVMQMVAGCMRANLVYFNGLVTVMQDRPSSPVKLITKASVIDGMFDYSGTGLFERHTGVNVTFNDKYDRHLQRITTIDATTTSGSMQTALTDAQNKYGYNPMDIAAFGATSEGQAIRQGRWALDTEIHQTEVAKWKMSLNGFDLLPGDVVKVYDEDYAATIGGGRVVSVVGTTVTIDRFVSLVPGSLIEVMLADGTTIESKAIVEISGNVNSFTIASAFSQSVLPQADFILTTAVEARQFKVIDIKQDDASTISIEAVLHDPNKYSRVETGVEVPTAIFSNVLRTTTSIPVGLAFKESAVNIDNTLKRSLLISWQSPATGIAAYYSILWRYNYGTWNTIDNHKAMSTELVNIQAGAYDVQVIAHTAYGNESAPLTGSYNINAANGGVSPLNGVTDLQDIVTGTAFFNGVDINFKWKNPSSNATVLNATLRDFQVTVSWTGGSRTFYVPAVAPGQWQYATYTYAMNVADSGAAGNRSVQIRVWCRDTNGNLSSASGTDNWTFNNLTPAAPSSISVTGGLRTIRVVYATPTDTDWAGVLIWMSTTNGFTTNWSNLVYDGKDSYVSIPASGDMTTYYLRVASYDTFGKSLDGTGMNLSAQYSVSTSASPGISIVPYLPLFASEGDIVFNSGDGKLYRYYVGAWTAAVPFVDVSGTIESSQIAANTITSGMLAADSVIAGKIAAASITSAEIASGTITATNIQAASITGDRLAAGTITATNIQAGTITATQIAATSITGDKMNVGALSGISANLGVITSGNITSGNVTSGSLTVTNNGAIKSGQTAYNTGSGFWLGDVAGTAKFSIGNSATGNKLTWDGTTLSVAGAIAVDYANVTGTKPAATADNTATALGAGVSLTGGGITLSTSAVINSGQTAYNTGTGYWLGVTTGTPKFSIGNPAGNYMTWDGSALTVVGTIVGSITDNRNYTAGGVPIGADTTTGIIAAAAGGVGAWVEIKRIYTPRAGTVTLSGKGTQSTGTGYQFGLGANGSVAAGWACGGAGSYASGSVNVTTTAGGYVSMFGYKSGVASYQLSVKDFVVGCGFQGTPCTSVIGSYS